MLSSFCFAWCLFSSSSISVSNFRTVRSNSCFDPYLGVRKEREKMSKCRNSRDISEPFLQASRPNLLLLPSSCAAYRSGRKSLFPFLCESRQFLFHFARDERLSGLILLVRVESCCQETAVDIHTVICQLQ